VGLFNSVQDIEQTVITAKNGAVLRVKDIATVPKDENRLGQIGRPFAALTEACSTAANAVEGIVSCRRG